MNRSNNFTRIFHIFIIASFLLSINGCGYKAPPYWEDEVPKSDDNVKFFIKDKSFKTNDNNESCQ